MGTVHSTKLKIYYKARIGTNNNFFGGSVYNDDEHKIFDD